MSFRNLPNISVMIHKDILNKNPFFHKAKVLQIDSEKLI